MSSANEIKISITISISMGHSQLMLTNFLNRDND